MGPVEKSLKDMILNHYFSLNLTGNKYFFGIII